MSEEKQLVRQAMLERMRVIPSEQRAEWECELGRLLLEECRVQSYQRVALYVGRFPEIQTLSIVQQLQQAGIDVYIPRTQANHQLSFHLFESEEALESGSHGILQPRQTAPEVQPTRLDVVVAPGIVFSESGERIGFGGGYYDRFLEQLIVPTLALAFPIQLLPQSSWQNESHDIKIDKLLLPK
ncbi:5-formyltetrahydrofolate cyclo-ligase [Aerococcaceae bacterium NML160702]|nr:5-formyltetrahydrofolate cyclo-ligase [Aerococcaceae bacterium NML160702]